ncbi:hypothetical protein J2X02_003505 [Pseudoxanthomonas japonensis]|nr:hypothetical protein [Pseudoxanthomonas japonensis]MDR7070640.1 hypothetical protein [Pseudoxanthomonas japonensis]
MLIALWLTGTTLPLSAQSAAVPPPLVAGPTDTLLDALSCRTATADLPGLLPRLRRERPTEFVQTERQYSAPVMDLYRLEAPVQAWGLRSDAVVITDDRVLLLVDRPIEQATAELERALEDSKDAPLSSALDDAHALVVYSGEHPGLTGRSLVGCEYRMPSLSLLADPADAWRTPTPTP